MCNETSLYILDLDFFPQTFTYCKTGLALNEIKSHKAMVRQKNFLIKSSKPGVSELEFEVLKKFHCIFKIFLMG